MCCLPEDCANESMKPFKLKEYLAKIHPDLANKGLDDSNSKKTSSRGPDWIKEQEFLSK